MDGLNWQVNWKVWHWPWHHSTVEQIDVLPEGFTYRSHFAGVGPFQFHWYSGL